MKPLFLILALCFGVSWAANQWSCETITSLTDSVTQLSASSQKVLQKRQKGLILWSSQETTEEYLQFHFQEFVEVWEVQVQSKSVMEFKLQYSESGEQDFRDLKEGKYGLPKVFFMHGEAQKLFSLDPTPVFAQVLMRKVNFTFYTAKFFDTHFLLAPSSFVLFTSLTELRNYSALNLLG